MSGMVLSKKRLNWAILKEKSLKIFKNYLLENSSTLTSEVGVVEILSKGKAVSNLLAA